MLPPKPKKLATAHPCFNSENDKLLQQWCSSPVASREQAFFFAVFETPFSTLGDSRTASQVLAA
jgi:hypothetical protein